MPGTRLRTVYFASHFACASKVVPNGQRTMAEKPECYVVGCRNPGGWSYMSWKKSMSKRECRHCHGVPTPGRPSFRGLSSWRATCGKTDVCHIYRSYAVVGWKSRNHFLGRSKRASRGLVPGTAPKLNRLLRSIYKIKSMHRLRDGIAHKTVRIISSSRLKKRA